MKTTEQLHHPYNDEGAKLRVLVTNKILAGLLTHLDPADLDLAELCKLAHTFCEIRKQDAACEKNIAAIEVAKIKTTAAAQPKHQGPHYDENEEAPYGRKHDGTPHTRAEFLKDLKRAVQDIYGFTEEQATTLIDGSQNAPSPQSPDRGERPQPIAQAMGAKTRNNDSPDRGDTTPHWQTPHPTNKLSPNQPAPERRAHGIDNRGIPYDPSHHNPNHRPRLTRHHESDPDHHP